MTQSFQDVEIRFRGKRAWAQARRVRVGASKDVTKVEVSSIRIEGDDEDGRPRQHTFSAADPNETGKGKALLALSDEDRSDILEQVRRGLR